MGTEGGERLHWNVPVADYHLVWVKSHASIGNDGI